MADHSHDSSTVFLKWVDACVHPIVWINIVMFLIEEELSARYGWRNSREAPRIFLWCERIAAAIFTIELFVRWHRSNPGYTGAPTTKYPFTILGFIDTIAIVPFWLGFFVPAGWLGVIRVLRILRLLKFFRYSRDLQLTALKFYRAYYNIRGIAFSVGIIWLLFAVMCLKLEQEAQPEKFGSLLDTAWFTIVTGTTVGYGDRSPETMWGKLFVGLMLIPIIATIGASISAMNAAFDAIQKEAEDPNVDPAVLFEAERERRRKLRDANKRYHMDE